MDEMVSLKQTYGELAKPVEGSDEYFPTVHIDGDAAKKLKISNDSIDDEMMLCAVVRVSHLSKGKGGTSVTLELLKAAIHEKDERPDPKTVLYGKD